MTKQGKNDGGCGRLLTATTREGLPTQLPCGSVDDFGIRQLCHTCNVRAYDGRPTSPEGADRNG